MSNNFKRADELARKITGAKMQIKEGKSTPKETGIGRMFGELKAIDEAAYSRLMKEYTPVFEAWKSKQENLLDEGVDAITASKGLNGK